MNVKTTFEYFIKYATSSLLAVALDYGLFVVLVNYTSLGVFISNLTSTTIGFMVAWLISGKTLFRKENLKLKHYLVWFTYQFVMIQVYSLAITFSIALLGHKEVQKFLLLAISFAINSLFFKFVVLNKRILGE